MIADFLSFGPKKLGAVNKFKDGRKNARPATANYLIREKVTAFKIPISAKKAEKLQAEVTKVRDEIDSGQMMYAVYMNDTCAETARDILDDADIKTPSGSGLISVGFLSIAYAVNPSKWHDNLKKDIGGEKVYSFLPTSLPWLPEPDTEDPIFSENPDEIANPEVDEEHSDAGVKNDSISTEQTE